MKPNRYRCLCPCGKSEYEWPNPNPGTGGWLKIRLACECGVWSVERSSRVWCLECGDNVDGHAWSQFPFKGPSHEPCEHRLWEHIRG